MALLRTARIYLRNFCRQDLQDMYEFCSQPEIEAVGWRAHKSLEETETVLEQWISRENTFAIVGRDTNKVMGYIAVHEDSEEGRADTRELGFALNRRYYRQGIMSEAVRLVLDDLFSGDVLYVWACCFQANVPSGKLIEKLGFERVQAGVFFSESFQKEIPSWEYRMSKSAWEASGKGFCH